MLLQFIQAVENFLLQFSTAPVIISDKVKRILLDGRANELIEAIHREKRGEPQTGAIRVKKK